MLTQRIIKFQKHPVGSYFFRFLPVSVGLYCILSLEIIPSDDEETAQEGTQPFYGRGSIWRKKFYPQNIISERRPTQKINIINIKHPKYEYGEKAMVIVQKLQSYGNCKI